MGVFFGILFVSELFLCVFVDYFQIKGNSVKVIVVCNVMFLSEDFEFCGLFGGYVRFLGFVEISDFFI